MGMNSPYEAYRKAKALGGYKQPGLGQGIGGVVVSVSDAANAAKVNNDEAADNAVNSAEDVVRKEAVAEFSESVEQREENLAEAETETGFAIDEIPCFVPAYQEKDPKPEEPKPLNPYFVNSVMTASPEKLTLMLYDGALKFMNESIKGIEAQDFTKAHKYSMKAQNIITELLLTLDQEYEVAKNMASLYNFILHNLVQGNVKKDVELVRQAMGLTQEFRDTWVEAMKIAGGEKGLHSDEDSVKTDIISSGKMGVK